MKAIQGAVLTATTTTRMARGVRIVMTMANRRRRRRLQRCCVPTKTVSCRGSISVLTGTALLAEEGAAAMKFVSRGRQLGALRSSGDKKETTTTTTTTAATMQTRRLPVRRRAFSSWETPPPPALLRRRGQWGWPRNSPSAPTWGRGSWRTETLSPAPATPQPSLFSRPLSWQCRRTPFLLAPRGSTSPPFLYSRRRHRLSTLHLSSRRRLLLAMLPRLKSSTTALTEWLISCWRPGCCP
mmetsp:Transcript_44685/g.82781  ORF Transcript_44685/g.82781 Transcript_44685/m.82781 type:complete len:240 (-) Transcript_44685:198-917(-)